jgi:hypothetical protein
VTAAIDRAEARWAADLATARAVAAAAVEARDAVAAWGLVVGGADDALDAPPVGAPPTLSLGGRALEAWALGAGCKRVAFVTVAPDDEAAVAAQFVGCHVERRTRAVAIGPGDRWCDDRQRGAPRVELYAAVDASDARRAAALQADDPTRHAAALGELFGYPPCCVAAFVAQRSRADNSLNRYLIAARTGAARGPWPWCLNEVHHRLIAFYPCRYDCAAARAVAEATLAAIDAARPGFATAAAATPRAHRVVPRSRSPALAARRRQRLRRRRRGRRPRAPGWPGGGAGGRRRRDLGRRRAGGDRPRRAARAPGSARAAARAVATLRVSDGLARRGPGRARARGA